VIIAAGTASTGSATTGVAINLALNTLTFSAVLVGLARMDSTKIRRPSRTDHHSSVLHDLREGVSYAIRTPLVRWCLVLLGGIGAFGFNFQILLPLYATGVLALGAAGYGAFYAVLGLGSLGGSLTLAYMRRRRAVPIFLVGGVTFAGLLLTIAATRQPLVAGALIFGAGYSSILIINTINATVQANVPDDLRGRVMSFYVTIFAGTAPIGSLLAGGIAEAYGSPAAFTVGSVLTLLTVGLVAMGLRSAARNGRLGRTILGEAVRDRAR
jgi:predicted MFS family arabinose efflux permease